MQKRPLKLHEIVQVVLTLTIAMVSVIDLIRRPGRIVTLITLVVTSLLAVIAISVIVKRNREFNRDNANISLK